MFDLVRNNKKFIQLVLAVIMLPFALWGVDSYVRNVGGNDVATVGGVPISMNEFQQALREQQERLQSQMGGNLPAEIIESPEFRSGVLQDLINQRLLAVFASKSNLRVSDETLAGFITSVPSLQENGKFSRERYQQLVAAQGMSIEMFEARVRQDMQMQQALMAVGNAALSGRLPGERWAAIQLEEREIREAVIRADSFAADSKPDAEAIQRYYDQHRARFETPEQVKLEYLVLSRDKLVEDSKVSDDEIKAAYQANQSRYATPEQRQASHILIRADKNAADSDIKAAQEKADKLLAQLKASPGDFAKLAKEQSQDPGSAAKGGDLGFFGRGMMVKPFEEAVFALKEGQLSEVVRSDFGFHIIKLTGIKPERVRPLEEVRGQIQAELKQQQAARRFAEAAEGFANVVYEQPDSLKPAAEKYRLGVQTTGWVARGAQAEAPFNHPKLMAAIFTDDAVKNKRNTEAVDVGNNTLVAARVIEHRPAAVEPLASVSGAIEKALAREAALAKATETGKAQLDKLTKGEKLDLAWSAPRTVSRISAQNLSAEARNAIFTASTGTLPSFVGTALPTGYVLYRIDKVKPYDPAAPENQPRSQALRQQYGQVIAQEEVTAWLAALRERFPVKINQAMLERKQ